MKSIRLYFVLMAFVGMLSPVHSWGAGLEGRTFDQVKIRYVSDGKKVIPVVCKIDNLKIVDIKLPDIVVENQGKEPVTIESIETVGKDADRTIATVWLHPEELTAMTGKIRGHDQEEYDSRHFQVQLRQRRAAAGEARRFKAHRTGEKRCLLLSTGAYLHYTGHSQIESMTLVIRILSGKSIPGSSVSRETPPITSRRAVISSR